MHSRRHSVLPLNTLCNVGAAPTWGFRSRLNVAALQATGLATNGLFPGEIGVTVPTTLGVNVGDEVYLTGWRRINTRSPGLAGAWQVVGILPPSSGPGPWTYFLGQSGNVSPTNFLALGKIAPLVYTYLPYASWTIKSSTSRKKGGKLQPASWEITCPEVSKRFGPCGQVWTYLRACYGFNMRVWIGGVETIFPAHWFFCDEGAPCPLRLTAPRRLRG